MNGAPSALNRYLVCGDTGHLAWCLEIVIGRRDAREPHRLAAASPSCGGLEAYPPKDK